MIYSKEENFISKEERESEVFYKVGKLLRSTREEKGLSLEEACHSLKIRKFFLESIETGHFEKLPGAVYALGFVKSYSVYLGLDFEELSCELEKLTTSFEKDSQLTNYCLPQPKNLLTKKALWISVFLTAFCFITYFFYQAKNNDTIAKMEQEADLIPGKSEVSTGTLIDKTSTVAIEEEGLSSTVVTIAANKETWIRVIDVNDQLIVARLLRPQNFYRLNTESGFRLTAGEAGALDVYLGEEKLTIPSLYGEGLLENFPIDSHNLEQYIHKPTLPEKTETKSE